MLKLLLSVLIPTVVGRYTAESSNLPNIYESQTYVIQPNALRGNRVHQRRRLVKIPFMGGKKPKPVTNLNHNPASPKPKPPPSSHSPKKNASSPQRPPSSHPPRAHEPPVRRNSISELHRNEGIAKPTSHKQEAKKTLLETLTFGVLSPKKKKEVIAVPLDEFLISESSSEFLHQLDLHSGNHNAAGNPNSALKPNNGKKIMFATHDDVFPISQSSSFSSSGSHNGELSEYSYYSLSDEHMQPGILTRPNSHIAPESLHMLSHSSSEEGILAPSYSYSSSFEVPGQLTLKQKNDAWKASMENLQVDSMSSGEMAWMINEPGHNAPGQMSQLLGPRAGSDLAALASLTGHLPSKQGTGSANSSGLHRRDSLEAHDARLGQSSHSDEWMMPHDDISDIMNNAQSMSSSESLMISRSDSSMSDMGNRRRANNSLQIPRRKRKYDD